MRIILIRINDMSYMPMPNKEILLSRKDIDFSKFTVDRLKREILKNIKCVASAVCESQDYFRRLVECGDVQIGEARTSFGKTFIFLSFHGQNILVPYNKIH